MKKILLIIGMIALIFIAGCNIKDTQKACTADAKICPDGTGVGRVLPNCEFAECPSTDHICTDDEKKAEICTMDYSPVCGNDGKTYGNGCGACSAKVNSWVKGECKASEPKTQTKCSEPRTLACTKEYKPTCGYFDETIKCIKYPCAATYGNPCTACADSKVAFIESGECPK